MVPSSRRRKPWRRIHWIEVLAWVAVAWIGICVAERGEGAELTEQQAALLYAVAYGEAGLGIPDFSPTIRLLHAAQLEQAVCGKPCAGLKAAQIGDVVLLRADLDLSDPLNASILLHELVHYVQWAKFGQAKDCADYRDRETQAYEIQFAALARIGVRAPKVAIPTCV